MKKKYQKIVHWLKSRIRAITPGKNAIRGAALGLLVVTISLWLTYSVLLSINIKDQWVLLLSCALILAATLLGFLVVWLIKLVHSISRFYKLALLIALPLFFLMSSDWIILLFFIVLSSLVGASILVLKRTGFQNLSMAKKVITIAGMIVGLSGFITAVVLYSSDGFDVDPIANAALSSETNIQQIKAASPATKGPHLVKTLTYGSGKDLHRPEYGAAVDLKTDSVNGLAFIDNWDGFGGWWREKYWGFDSKSLPINARVWYPEGDGPFPLTLIVHGNHSMQDYSDPGYEYLGELLASRGIILASIDENFINGSWSDIFGGLDKENDARGWLLLEHLKLWHEWNKTDGHLFYNKIDTSNLALIGHSRGGEAVAHAAMFNTLLFYPDDATVKFDYNYNIQSIIAIAPCDGQYEPGNSRTKIEDVNYFVIHGAQDADVSSFMGSQQYERVTFKDSLYHIKSGLYVYGANHGQFNTSWGPNDVGNPFIGMLNLKQLLSADAQRQIAKVYISSFLEVTLRNKHEYLPLFTDSRTAKDWLPETIYLNQFEDSNTEFICTFDEDFDVSSTTNKSGIISSENLSVWREQEVKLKWQKKGSRALFLGWNYKMEDDDITMDSVPDSLIASYSIQIPSRINDVDSSSVFIFSMAESTEESSPKSKGKWIKNKNSEKDGDEKGKVDEDDEDDEDDENDENDEENNKEPKKPLDFTILLEDSTGQEVLFALSDFSALQREIKPVIRKMEFLTGDNKSEKVFQLFYFPFRDFQKINPDFNHSSIEKISFIFDRNESGVVAIDNIGFMKSL